MKENQTVLTPPPGAADDKARKGGQKGGFDEPKSFAFDRSYWSFDKNDSNYAGQDNLFTDLGAPLLDNAFGGYNNCIFAYGQTGSGKSYSMMGYGEEYGIIPKICRDMFERISVMQEDKTLACTVEVSYLEIYNERVRDLLNPATKGNLKVREHPSTGPYVEDLAKLVVRSFAEIENLMDEGNKARTVAATNMNETSSRSHAVFTLTLTQKKHDVETSMDSEKVSRISLVDLAGSERATSTGATGARLKEGAEINRSLSTLGRVIAALADISTAKKKGKSQVPYRDSVLTWLLKDSLGGNSMTAMIAAISPADINYDETLSTLRYADSAKRIKNHAVVNEDPNARMIRELKEELAQLRSKLGGGGGGVGGMPAEETYAPGTPLEKQIVSITQPDGTVKQVSKAEIVEQLNQSEKLYQDLNQTWEQKLQKTEEIQKEREAALEELGISIEKGFVGLSTPKKMPHLVNLSDDPLLAECLVYNLKPGSTKIGTSETLAEIRLNGSKILPEHCTLENVDNIVTLVPSEGAAVMVNGKRIDKPTRLRSGFRIILGDFHIYRFNHPQEARAERAESLLRHTVTASQLNSPAPSTPVRPGHDRTISKTGSEFDGDSSPASPSLQPGGRDSDWFYARREAASAILGPDQKIAHLTDDELNNLFDDVQRVRAVRRGKTEKTLELEEDSDSLSSFPVRDKYMSNGTIDNFSLDTAITMPSTPLHVEDGADGDERLSLARDDMQRQLDKQKETFQEKLRSAIEGTSAQDVEELRAEKVQMEQALKSAKEEFQRELKKQKAAHEDQLRELNLSPRPKSIGRGLPAFSEEETALAKWVIAHWKSRNYVRMAESVLKNASLLKEAQVMSQIMDKHITFQFVIIDDGHSLVSSYDLVLTGISGDEDEALDAAKKPCIGVRVTDYKHCVIYTWSLEKLKRRVQLMRQMQQYMDRPEYLQHFRIDNPFSETCLPQFSLIGDADIPLTAVFETTVQDFAAEVISPYTQSVVGIVNLSLEPSMAQAPSSTLKFNVVMHDMVGFAEREGTDVHAQLFVPGVSEEGGATTTQIINGFDENPIRFESVHSMSLPFSSPRTSSLRISVFARVTAMHLDKLLSWDDMRDAMDAPPQKRKKPRLPETEFFSDERHDVFARLQFMELAEDGQYQPVEVVQKDNMDVGTYQLHQGLQRRVVVNLVHSSTESLPWEDLTGLSIGSIRYVDAWGKAANLDNESPDIPLKLIQEPMVKDNADGTSNVTLIGQWDSSLHNSLLLDRVTADKYRVQVTLRWHIISTRLEEPMAFTMDQMLQILPRSFVRPQSMFKQFWNATRIVHSTTGIFSITVRPVSAKRAADLWRMNTQHDYVKGEELLTNWAPRKVSLIKDFIAARKRRQRIAELEAARGILSLTDSLVISKPSTQDPTDEQKEIIEKFLGLWKSYKDISEIILVKNNTEPPTNGASTPINNVTSEPSIPNTPSKTLRPRFIATIKHVPKNASVLKSGYLLTPDDTNSKWVRRFVELRVPYFHVYSVPEGDEINAINLRNSRIDHDPDFARLLGTENGGHDAEVRRGRPNVFAVYGTQNTFLFAARTEGQKVEWILKIDQSYFSGSGSGSGSGSNSVE